MQIIHFGPFEMLQKEVTTTAKNNALYEKAPHI